MEVSTGPPDGPSLQPCGSAISITISVTAAAEPCCKDQKDFWEGFNKARFSFLGVNIEKCIPPLPDYDNDAVKAVVWVLDVAKEPQSQEL